MARTEGHREKLLEAAKQCLYERGYARTTARDLVAASGTNLASIGYHFGSKEALLTEALFSSLQDLSDQLDRGQEQAAAEAARLAGAPAEPLEQLRMMWAGAIESYTSHRAVWAASFEAFAQIDHLPDLRERVADLYEEMRTDSAELARAADPTIDDGAADAFGSFLLAVMAGLTLQHLLDPARAPTSDDLVTGVRTLVDLVADAPETVTKTRDQHRRAYAPPRDSREPSTPRRRWRGPR